MSIRRMSLIYSMTAVLGVDAARQVTEDYKEGDNRFTGQIAKVTIDLKEIRAAGIETPEKDLREASSRKALAD